MSDEYHKETLLSCRQNGVAEPLSRKRNEPLRCGGIGHGSQQADYDAKFSIGINQRFNELIYKLKFAELVAPVLQNSDAPGIIGQSALKANRVILAFFNMRMYTIDPGKAIIELPPGSEVYDPEESREGHLLLPCDRYPNPGMTPTPGPMKICHTAVDCENE